MQTTLFQNRNRTGQDPQVGRLVRIASSVQFRTGDKGGSTAGGACDAGIDFMALSGNLDFAASEMTRTMTVTVCADTLDDPQGVARIVDDDPAPEPMIRCSGVGEGNALSSNTVCAVGITAPSGFPVRVDYATPYYPRRDARFTALPGTTCGQGVHFIATSGRLEIPATPPWSATITVPVCGDTRGNENETFPLMLSDLVNAVIRSEVQSDITINNDDLPELRISSTTVTEPASGGSGVEAILVLSLTGYLPTRASIGFTCANGTAIRSSSKTCDGSDDYVLRGGVIDLWQAQSNATISVPICRDTAREGTATFQVRLSNPSGVALVNSTASVTIVDND
jgi:hypothetical protein